MALPKKNKIARFLKPTPNLNAQANRSAQAKLTGLYLLELRTRHAVTQSTLPRRKLVVSIEPGKSPDSPRPIRITYHT